MSLIVPDFTISVYVSSYSLFFGLILFAPLSSLSIHFHLQCSKECLGIYVERKEERIKPTKGELYELPYKEDDRFLQHTDNNQSINSFTVKNLCSVATGFL